MDVKCPDEVAALVDFGRREGEGFPFWGQSSLDYVVEHANLGGDVEGVGEQLLHSFLAKQIQGEEQLFHVVAAFVFPGLE